MDNIVYSYIKIRKNFGKQPMFSEVPSHMIDSINPNKREQKQYILRNPVNHETQASVCQSEVYINTKRIILHNEGVNHAEGGWPKDINFADEELTSRYRRRIERDDTYVDAVMNLYPTFEHYINQNNAIEMYDLFFKEMVPELPVERSYIRTNNIYKDPSSRRIASISWTHEEDSKLVIAYCNKKYPVKVPLNNNLQCYIWNIENPLYPMAEFLPPVACWQAVCSPIHPSIIVGGLEDGTVCVFDIRVKCVPNIISPTHLAHRDPVSSVLYIQSRLNTEFFSGSSDGKCMWWDIRNISTPIDSLIMSVCIPPGEKISLANAEGVSCLQYERSFPTKFLCGTDTGMVINVNRKGKSHQEKMSAIYHAHNGPVKAIHRSPCTSKIFITCGDWTAHIWSDDIHISPIIFGKSHRYQILDVVWAPQRVSSYMSVSADGKFRYWDLLRRHHDPIITLPISKYPLLKIKPQEDGRLVAIGDTKGSTSLLSFSDNLILSGDRDKQLMLQMFDRETRREHILETRVKEIRLKLKTEDEAGSAPLGVVDEDAFIKTTEDEYRRIVQEEMRRTGIVFLSGTKDSKMRKR
ncbi:dynein intermediate chain 3, ciliary-like [Galleria mellonella]|uniref:Dynein intermediate chain 3, ciliary-like n=1 Tax=Galleria mellonella TaxID=7137 RepID=A0A6J1WIX8_GALME|nr:dynein intermediate chain 3, ciliary-like [Galleria mellonella]